MTVHFITHILSDASRKAGQERTRAHLRFGARSFAGNGRKDGCLGEASLPLGKGQSNKGREVSPRPPGTGPPSPGDRGPPCGAPAPNRRCARWRSTSRRTIRLPDQSAAGLSAVVRLPLRFLVMGH